MDRESMVEYGERTVEMFMMRAEEEWPLRYRILMIDVARPAPVGCDVIVCSEGHIHVYFGPLTTAVTMLVDTLLAYTVALILDTKPNLPKQPSRHVVVDRFNKMLHFLMELDSSVGAAYAQHFNLIRQWINNHTTSRGGRPVFPEREQKPPHRAPAARRRRGTSVTPQPPQKLAQTPEQPLRAPTEEERGEAALADARSMLMFAPDGSLVVVGVLNMPMTLGEA
jgi:hypothetical protein